MKSKILLLCLLVSISACNKKADSTGPSPTAQTPTNTDAPFRSNPDFGGVQTVTVEAEGVGPTPGVAALYALDTAIAQVNGRRVTSGSAAAKSGASVDVAGLGRMDVNSTAYLETVVSASDGAVKSFTVLDSQEVEKTDFEHSSNFEAQSDGVFGSRIKAEETMKGVTRYWRVKVKAEVAKFVGPKDDGRPSIVVAAPKFTQGRFPVGDTTVEAEVVAKDIRARLSDALTQTGRFMVLDREFSDELQAEVDFINSGNARNEEVARLGQRLATDLILVPTIEQFSYPKSSRTLRLSGRELTSYSGGGRLSLRLINATTGEVVMSESFDHRLPPTGPSTLPRSVDGPGMVATMMSALSGKMSKSIIGTIFPVSVIQLNGDKVVLSQGGKSVSVGERYDAVLLGQELKDPQTGRSLGRDEQPCCVIRIERVSTQTSYGVIEDVASAPIQNFRPGQIELRSLAGSAAKTVTAESKPEDAEVASSSPAPRRSAGKAPRRATKARAGSKSSEDENW